jgi:hypothetical protein
MPPLPPAGFELLGYLQQRAESSSGIGAYLGGVPNQTSDKTQGTATGIQSLIAQAVSPVRDRQLNLEESIIEPVVNKWLKYAGRLMGKDEIKYVFVGGQSPRWVSITKGLLLGKIKISDLLEAELIPEEDIQEIVALKTLEGQQKDPGYIFDPEKEIVFDVDWIIRVEAGSMAEEDTEKDLQAFDSSVMMARELGVPLDPTKVWQERAMRAGIKEPEQYIMQPQQGMGQDPNMMQPGSQSPTAPPMLGNTPIQMPVPAASEVGQAPPLF